MANNKTTHTSSANIQREAAKALAKAIAAGHARGGTPSSPKPKTRRNRRNRRQTRRNRRQTRRN